MKPIRMNKVLLLFGALTLAAPLAPVPAFVPDARADAIPSFRDEAKKALPAVVTVKVETQAQSQDGLQPFPFQDPQLREFFKRFFGDIPGMPGMPGPQGDGSGRAPHETGLGSGFFIDKSGLVVTNNHVVGEADKITVVTQDGQEYPATLVGTDDKTDLAVVRVKADHDFPTLSWGDSEQTEVGDWVLAIGNPFGLGGTVTAGIVSARGRNLHSGPYDDFLQVDAPINRGNSGGPLLNQDGQVVGVNAAILSPSGGNIGIGFAIPANMAREVTAALIKQGHVERGWLGVSIQPVTRDIAESLGLAEASGALVASVQPGGPAEAGGIKTGDVIQSFDGKKIATLRDLTTTVADTKPGTKADVTVWRSGETRTISVDTGTMPAGQAAEAAVQGSQPEADTTVLGLTLKPVEDGLEVTAVDPASDAADEGIQAGDTIVAVDQEPVHSVADVKAALAKAAQAERKSVLILLSRDGSQRFVTVKRDAA